MASCLVRNRALLLVTLTVAAEVITVVSQSPRPLWASSTPMSITGTLVSGPISGDVTWTPAGNPYWIEGTVNVTTGSTLRLRAGVVALFNRSSLMNVQGSFVAIGDAINPIVIMPNATVPEPLDRVEMVVDGSLTAENVTMERAHLDGIRASMVSLERVRYIQGGTIQMDRVGAVSIKRSDIEFVPDADLSVQDSSGVDISFNTVRSTVTAPGFAENGIWIRRSPDARVISNEVDGRFLAGVTIESDRALVAGNRVRGGQYDGHGGAGRRRGAGAVRVRGGVARSSSRSSSSPSPPARPAPRGVIRTSPVGCTSRTARRSPRPHGRTTRRS